MAMPWQDAASSGWILRLPEKCSDFSAISVSGFEILRGNSDTLQSCSRVFRVHHHFSREEFALFSHLELPSGKS